QKQLAWEGADQFIQDDPYFRTYSAYIARFIQEYSRQGIKISMVMPQNEFNSPHPFPSCSWTAEGLARFISFLGKLVDIALLDPKAGKHIKGAGFQWAGKRAIVGIHRRYPALKLYQTEQECGDGKNDWRYCRYAWTLLKRFLENGVSAYHYWNIALKGGGVSRWGWAQNSLVTVDTTGKNI